MGRPVDEEMTAIEKIAYDYLFTVPKRREACHVI